MNAYRKILVPCDLSRLSQPALDAAAGLAGHRGVSVTLLHVQEPSLHGGADEHALGGGALDDLDELQRRLDALAASLRAAGAPQVDTLLVRGTPIPDLIRCCAETGYDLIVMSTRGRTGLAHALLGSITERVVRTAPCPVLTIRSAVERDAA